MSCYNLMLCHCRPLRVCVCAAFMVFGSMCREEQDIMLSPQLYEAPSHPFITFQRAVLCLHALRSSSTSLSLHSSVCLRRLNRCSRIQTAFLRCNYFPRRSRAPG